MRIVRRHWRNWLPATRRSESEPGVVATFAAFYDANVLYPAELRNFLMHLALTELFRAKWSAQVHEEWMSNLLANRPDLRPEQLERTRDLMNRHAVDALVVGYEDLIPGLNLRDFPAEVIGLRHRSPASR